MEMLDRTIRHDQTVFKIKILLVVFRAINDLLDQSSIVWMSPLENQRKRPAPRCLGGSTIWRVKSGAVKK